MYTFFNSIPLFSYVHHVQINSNSIFAIFDCYFDYSLFFSAEYECLCNHSHSYRYLQKGRLSRKKEIVNVKKNIDDNAMASFDGWWLSKEWVNKREEKRVKSGSVNKMKTIISFPPFIRYRMGPSLFTLTVFRSLILDKDITLSR